MKKIVLAITSLLISGVLSAQDEKLTISQGTVVLGGSGQISTINTTSDFFGSEESNNNSLLLIADIGYSVIDDLVIGGNINYSKSETENSETQFTGFGVFAEKYKGVGKKATIHLRVDGLYFFGESVDTVFNVGIFDDNSTTTTDVSSFSFRLSPGFSYFITPKIALRATIGLLRYSVDNRENNEEDFKTTTKTFDASVNLSNVSIGVNFYL